MKNQDSCLSIVERLFKLQYIFAKKNIEPLIRLSRSFINKKICFRISVERVI